MGGVGVGYLGLSGDFAACNTHCGASIAVVVRHKSGMGSSSVFIVVLVKPRVLIFRCVVLGSVIS